jgi:acetolactate synthase-1/2/3 large subunit
MELTGSQIVIECLKEQGVDTIFGYPGGSILNIYDELYKHSDEITHILTSHEQGASHAADGYARATGKVGVCMATSGPGATNLVTGIATAYMDSVPVVAITANVGLPLLGKDTFQEVDIAGVTMPITKHSFIVKDVTKLADTLRKAFQIARTGRPGPVLVDITKDVTANKTEYVKKTFEEIKAEYDYLTEKNTYSDKDIDTVAAMIAECKKPFIYLGGGAIISGACDEVREFAKKIDSPVCDTLMGKGAFDGYDDLYTGMIGMHGTKASNFGVNMADLLIVVGARFSDRVIGNAAKFAKSAKILHIDIDAAEINKNIDVDASVVGDAAEILKKINAGVKESRKTAWMKEIKQLMDKNPLNYDMKHLTGPAVVSKIYEETKGNAIITTDVGQHQMWAAQYYKYKKPRMFLTSGGLGTMGYGLGAAIGAQVGQPSKTVINIAGDGCFRMNMNELATAARENVHVIEVVINNQVLGMVRQWQTLFYGKRYSNTVLSDGVDFVKVSEGLGATAFRVTTVEEFTKALREALKGKGPYVIDCQIQADDKVWPMVAPGAAIETCFDSEEALNK